MEEIKDQNLLRDFQRRRDEEALAAYRVAVFLAILLFPLFSVLDYFTHPEKLVPLTVIRYVTTAVFVGLYLVARRGIYPGSPQVASRVILAAATVSLTGMCLVLGGYKSAYYGGINLVTVASALFPWNALQMAATVAIILGIYLVSVLTYSGFVIDNPQIFITNLYFLFSTGVIAIAIGHFSDRLRTQSYLRLLERQALEARDQFISVAAHELKTPLTATLLLSQVMRRKPVEEAFAISGRIERQLKHLTRLVDDMLDLSRIRAGKFQLSPAPVNLSELVSEVVESYAEAFKTQDVQLDKTITPEIRGNWDGYRLEQVVTNLLSNALKYGDGKPVKVKAWQANGHAFIQVKDQGIGIAPELQPKVFDRFERALAVKEISGLGLGLFIVKQIVLAHGGSIELVSQPDHGSEFTVTLPTGTNAPDLRG